MANIDAQTQEDENLEKLAYEARRQKAGLDTCRNFDDIVAYVEKYQREFPINRELAIAKYGEIDPGQIEKLKALGYPEDYIAWAEKYGNCYLEAGISIPHIEAALHATQRFGPLTANGYLYFGYDENGDPHTFDKNDPGNPIKIFHIRAAIRQADLGEKYETVYVSDYLSKTHGPKVEQKTFFDILHHHLKYDLSKVLEPPRYGRLMDIAGFHEKKGDFDRSIAILDAIIDVVPDIPDGINNRAFAYRLVRKFDLALADADRCIAMRPDDGLSHGTKAEILFDMGEEEAFFESLELALQNGMAVALIEDAIVAKYGQHPRFGAMVAPFNAKPYHED